MTKIYRLLLIITSVLLGCKASGAIGPDQQPVMWTAGTAECASDSCVAVVRATVADGWHLYGFELPDDGPCPTSFDLAGSTGVEFTGDARPMRAPVVEVDPVFGAELSWWDSDVEFAIPFKVVDPTAAKIVCRIFFMACNGDSCRPPRAETLVIPVTSVK